MKLLVCLTAAVLAVSATPQGYYHQEYNYKTSSSSFKNNELQHQTDDRGHYSKSGDIEGRTKPKIKSDSEHSEYINPKLSEGYYDGNADLASQRGQLSSGYGLSAGGSASSGYQAGSQYGQDYSQGASSADLYRQQNSGYYGSQGSSSNQYSYSSSALNNVATRLQSDLQQEIRSALQSGQSQYANRIDVSELEAELRRNLTVRLQQLLQEQFGNQAVRGGQSYSLVAGHMQSRPNYEQQELVRLQDRLENTLLQELRREYSQRYSSQHSYNQNYGNYETTTYRPVYPNLNTIPTERPYPSYPGVKTSYPTRDRYQQPYPSQNQYQQSQTDYNRVVSNIRYTPVPNPLSITNIVSNVQGQMDSKLNRLLTEADTRYFSENSGYSSYNLDSVLERLRQELKSNLTNAINEEIRSQYGSQIQKDGYSYSVGSAGQVSEQYNYNQADLDSLRRQVESNLLTKLNRDFESARQRWVVSQQQQQNRYVSTGQRYTNNYDTDYYAGRPQNTGVKDTGYGLIVGGSQQSGYEVSGSSGSRVHGYETSGSNAQVANLQSQLQSELGRQIQAAINQNRQYTNVHTAGYGSASFDEVYQRLYEELQRNLTRQLQEFMSESGYSSSSSSGVSDSQLASLKSQLQNSLASQLQQGLRQSYSASASYSASSSGSTAAGAGSYSSSNSGGSYRTTRGQESEGCCGYGYRRKRSSYGGGYRSQPLGLSNYGGSGGYRGHGGYGGYGGYGQSGSYGGAPIAQQEEDSDLSQKVEPLNQQTFVGQEVDDDDTQQVEVDEGFSSFGSQHKLGQQQQHVGQEEIDLGQIEDSSEDGASPGRRPTSNLGGFTSFQIGSQSKPSSERPISYAGAVSGQKPIAQVSDLSLDIDAGPAFQPGSQTQEKPRVPQRGDQPPPGGLTGQHPQTEEIENEPDGYAPSVSQASFKTPVYTGQLRPISSLQISASEQLITEEIQLYLTDQIDLLIQNELPGQGKTRQVYTKILGELNRKLTTYSQKRLKNVNRVQYVTIEEFLQYNLYQKLIYELLQHGFSRETLGLDSATNTQLHGQFPKPQQSYDFIQGEINYGLNQGPSQGTTPALQDRPATLIPSQSQANNNQRQPTGQQLSQAEQEADWLINQLKKAQKPSTTEEPVPESTTSASKNLYEEPTLDFIEKYISGLNAVQLESVRRLDVELYEYVITRLYRQVEIVKPQHLSPEEAYETVLHTLEVEIDDIIAGTVRGNKPDLLRYHKLIKKKLNRRHSVQLEEYLSVRLNKWITEKLREVYDIQTVQYQSPTYESLQNQISDLSVDQYQIVRHLDIELQKEINKLISKQVRLAQGQHRPAEEAYITILHTLEEEIKVLVQDTLKGSKPELQRFSRPIRNKLTEKQQLELKEYLKTALTESVTQHLSKVYNIEAPKQQVPAWYQAPTYESIRVDISDLTLDEYDNIKKLDVELQKQIRNQVDKKVKLIQQQHLSVETVFYTLETEIETLLRETLEGSRPELEKISGPVRHKLTKKQQVELNEYLKTALTESVTQHLSETYNIEAPKQQVPAWYEVPTYESVKGDVSDLTLDEYDNVKKLDVELQKQIRDLVDKQVKIIQQQHLSVETSYTTVLHTLETEIDTLVRETLGGSRPELQRFSEPVRNKLTKKQQIELKEYLKTALTGSVTQHLTEIYNIEAPKQQTPSWYEAPTYESVLDDVSDLTLDEYDYIQKLDVELQKQIRDLVDKQVKLAQQQPQSMEKSYTTILHTLETEIETLVRETLRGSKPELQRYTGPLKSKLSRAQQQQLKQYFSHVLNESVTKQLTEVYRVKTPKVPSYESLQVKISDLTPEQYQPVQQLDVELQKYIKSLIDKQVKLVEHQNKSPQEAYVTVYHTLEAEIETLIRETLRGHNPELQAFSRPVKSKLSRKQIQDLNQYLNDVLTESLATQLGQIYNVEAPKPTRPTYQTPQFESLENQIPNLSVAQYQIIKQLDGELGEYLNELIQKQVKLAQQQHVSPEETYVTVLHTLEEEIERLIGGTLNGHRPELLKYHSIIRNKLTRKQQQHLREYLNTALTDSVVQQLSQIYGVETTKPSVPTVPVVPSVPSLPTVPSYPSIPSHSSVPSIPSLPTVPSYPSIPPHSSVPSSPLVPSFPTVPSYPSTPSIPTYPSIPSNPSIPTFTSVPLEPEYQTPTYESLQSQIPDLTVNQYETVKELDVELQQHINNIIEKQIKLAQQQHVSSEEAYVIVLHTIEAEIESLVQGTFGGGRPEFTKYSSLVRNKFNRSQHQQLREYLSVALTKSVTQQLSKVYVDAAPQPTLPTYQPLAYVLVQEQISDLTPGQYENVKELDVDLQEYLNGIIQKEVRLIKQQHLSPEEAYKIVMHTLESEIETLVQGTVKGERPELQPYTNLVKYKFNNRQLQQLQEYLTITLNVTVKKHLLRIYHLKEETTYMTNKPQYKVIRVKLENITTSQYNIIKQIEAEFSQHVESAIANQDLSGHGDLSSYDKYQLLTNKLEAELQKNLTDLFIGAAEPGLSKYSEMIDRNFERSKIPDVQKYLEIRLIKKIRDVLTQKYNVGSFTSSGLGNSEYQYHSSKQITTHFGKVEQVSEGSDQTQEIEPVVYQHATVVHSPPIPQTHPTGQSEADDVEIISPSSEAPLQTTTEAGGWWSRFGSKVKSIKEKIVG